MPKYDVIFESSDGFLYNANSAFLEYRCPKYFKDIEWENPQTIIKVDFIGEVVHYFIDFVYNNVFPDVPTQYLLEFLSMSLQFDGPYERCVSMLFSKISNWKDFDEIELRNAALGIKDTKIMDCYLRYKIWSLGKSWDMDGKNIEDLMIGDFCEIKFNGFWRGVQIIDVDETKFEIQFPFKQWILKSGTCVKGSRKSLNRAFNDGMELHTTSCANFYYQFKMICTCKYLISEIVQS
jgi:hypothetical protein